MSSSASTVTYATPAHGDVHRPMPGARNNEWLGMVLFLLSEAIIFGAIFAQYFYVRTQQPTWPPFGAERVPAAPLALGLTVILGLSGFTAHWAQTAARRDDQESLRAWLAVTIALGVVFLVGQGVEYSSLLAGQGLFGEAGRAPLGINSGIYGSVFFTLTGLHGLHVTGGVIALSVVLGRALMNHFTPSNHFAVEGTILYWHFVDVVWFVLYLAVYLM
ncbi:MAG: heme-copper oxidase subunit III [Chloroflexi bacterium]|nr:heme-copper oxidase subunit III [Chloroflexota bacterium]